MSFLLPLILPSLVTYGSEIKDFFADLFSEIDPSLGDPDPCYDNTTAGEEVDY